jgi:predicted nucleotidyltransferase
MTDDDRESLRSGLKRVAVALKDADLPFALAGGYAAWAHGGPEPEHDVDFLISADLADRAAEELARRGLEVEHPPEDWLFKVWTDGVMVDVLHRVAGSTPEQVLEQAVELEVLSVRMPVITATDVVVEKLMALDEHYCDLAGVLPVMRALREQVDWEAVRKQTTDSAFAAAVLFLLERLDVISGAGGDER